MYVVSIHGTKNSFCTVSKKHTISKGLVNNLNYDLPSSLQVIMVDGNGILHPRGKNFQIF